MVQNDHQRPSGEKDETQKNNKESEWELEPERMLGEANSPLLNSEHTSSPR